MIKPQAITRLLFILIIGMTCRSPVNASTFRTVQNDEVDPESIHVQEDQGTEVLSSREFILKTLRELVITPTRHFLHNNCESLYRFSGFNEFYTFLMDEEEAKKIKMEINQASEKYKIRFPEKLRRFALSIITTTAVVGAIALVSMAIARGAPVLTLFLSAAGACVLVLPAAGISYGIYWFFSGYFPKKNSIIIAIVIFLLFYSGLITFIYKKVKAHETEEKKREFYKEVAEIQRLKMNDIYKAFQAFVSRTKSKKQTEQ